MKLKVGMKVKILPPYKEYGMEQIDLNLDNIYTTEKYGTSDVDYSGRSLKEVTKENNFYYRFREKDLKVVSEVYCI